MDITIVSPSWFFGYDSLTELISMVILFVIGFYSWRLYKLSQEKKYKYFNMTFIMLGIALLAKSVTNWIIYREWVEHELYVGKIIQLYLFYTAGYLLFVLLSLAAYMLLLLLLWDINDKKAVSLFFIFIIFMTFFANHIFSSFNFVSFVLLSYLTWEFWKNAYRRPARTKAKPATARMVFISFLILTLSQLVFICMEGSQIFYVLGEIVQLAGYLLLLVTLLVLRCKKC
jgi:hypothetical protein